jgi:hypothetical protein
MGYSPGEFKCKADGEDYHWELKDGPRVVLWNSRESCKMLDLDPGEFQQGLHTNASHSYAT